MATCPKCGTLLSEGAKFCHACGTPVQPIANNFQPYQQPASATTPNPVAYGKPLYQQNAPQFNQPRYQQNGPQFNQPKYQQYQIPNGYPTQPEGQVPNPYDTKQMSQMQKASAAQPANVIQPNPFQQTAFEQATSTPTAFDMASAPKLVNQPSYATLQPAQPTNAPQLTPVAPKKLGAGVAIGLTLAGIAIVALLVVMICAIF